MLLSGRGNKETNRSDLGLLPWRTVRKIKSLLLDPVCELMTCIAFSSVCALLNTRNTSRKGTRFVSYKANTCARARRVVKTRRDYRERSPDDLAVTRPAWQLTRQRYANSERELFFSWPRQVRRNRVCPVRSTKAPGRHLAT